MKAYLLQLYVCFHTRKEMTYQRSAFSNTIVYRTIKFSNSWSRKRTRMLISQDGDIIRTVFPCWIEAFPISATGFVSGSSMISIREKHSLTSKLYFILSECCFYKVELIFFIGTVFYKTCHVCRNFHIRAF